MANSIAQRTKFSVAISTPAYQRLILNTLRDPKRASRFVASITSAVAVSPALQECEASSIIACALLGESLNLSPSPQLGQYYLVPFEVAMKDKDGNTIWLLDDEGNHVLNKNKKWQALTIKKAGFVLGYKGYIQLAIRSGYYKDIDAMTVHEGEYLGRDPANGKPLFSFLEDVDEAERRPVVGYMAYFEYTNGFKKTLYWSADKMLKHADKHSPAFSAAAYHKIQNGEISDKDMWKYSSHWYDDFDDMAKKTMLRQLISKWGIMSIEMQTAFENEDHIVQAQDGGIFTPEDDTPAAEVPEQTANTIPAEALQPEAAQTVTQASLDDF